ESAMVPYSADSGWGHRRRPTLVPYPTLFRAEVVPAELAPGIGCMIREEHFVEHRLHIVDRCFGDDGSSATDRCFGIQPWRVVAAIRQRQRLVRLEIEEVEPDTGDVSDESIDGVEHGENIALHEDLMLQRFVADGLVGLCDELEDSRIRL